MFVKPAGTGSSVGVSKANGRSELRDALLQAGIYDEKILVEEITGGTKTQEILSQKGYGLYNPEAEIRFPIEDYDEAYVKRYFDVSPKKIDGILEVRDESDKDGLQIAIDLKKDANAENILKSHDIDIEICKKAKFSYPGGCDIGTRPIDLHLKGFEKLGININ